LFIVDWDIPSQPTTLRRMFYYHLNKIKNNHNLVGSMSSRSVFMVQDKKLAQEVYSLASKYGHTSLYQAEILESNNLSRRLEADPC
jgi:hypothetical protein